MGPSLLRAEDYQVLREPRNTDVPAVLMAV